MKPGELVGGLQLELEVPHSDARTHGDAPRRERELEIPYRQQEAGVDWINRALGTTYHGERIKATFL